MLNVTSVVIMLCGVTIAAFSQILLKTSANQAHQGFLKQYLNKNVILGYLLLLVSMLFSVWALSGMDMRFAPAMESVGFVLVMIFSRVILKEKFTKRKIIGNILIVTGIVVYCL